MALALLHSPAEWVARFGAGRPRTPDALSIAVAVPGVVFPACFVFVIGPEFSRALPFR